MQITDVIDNVNADLKSVSGAAHGHGLILNPGKTVVLLFGLINGSYTHSLHISDKDVTIPLLEEHKDLDLIMSNSL